VTNHVDKREIGATRTIARAANTTKFSIREAQYVVVVGCQQVAKTTVKGEAIISKKGGRKPWVSMLSVERKVTQ
jgi:hypothetical protein